VQRFSRGQLKYYSLAEEPFEEQTVVMIENELCAAIKGIMSSPKTRVQIDDAYVNLKHDNEKLMSTLLMLRDHKVSLFPRANFNSSYCLYFSEEYNGIKDSYGSIQRQIDELRRQIYASFRPEIQVRRFFPLYIYAAFQ
jgi:hypothetical protein